MFAPDRPRQMGQALVEFVIITPLMLTLLLASVDMSRLFFAYIGAQNAAREGAAYASVHPDCPASGGGCSDPANTTYVARQEVGGDTGLTVGVTCASTCASSTDLEGNTVTVEVSYPFELLIPNPIGSLLTLRASSTAVIQ